MKFIDRNCSHLMNQSELLQHFQLIHQIYTNGGFNGVVLSGETNRIWNVNENSGIWKPKNC